MPELPNKKSANIWATLVWDINTKFLIPGNISGYMVLATNKKLQGIHPCTGGMKTMQYHKSALAWIIMKPHPKLHPQVK